MLLPVKLLAPLRESSPEPFLVIPPEPVIVPEKVVSELGYQANKLKADPDSYADLPACCKIGGMDKI